MDSSPKRDQTCPHCRAENTRVIGCCSVCSRTACEFCGNVQFSEGKRNVVHRECLRDHGDAGFKMIKFVR